MTKKDLPCTISRLAALIAFLSVAFSLVPAAKAQTDEKIRDLIAAAGEAEDYPGSGYVSVLERTDVTVEETGLAHFRRYSIEKILTPKGALERSVMRFDYDPASNFISIERTRIFRASGEVENVDLSRVVDLFQPASMIYWGGRMKVLELPRLSVGDAVEIETYKKGFEIAYLDEGVTVGSESPDEERYVPPMRGHFYDVVHFRADHPIKEKRYDLHVPPGKPIRYRVYNGPLYSEQRFDDKGTHYSFWIYDSQPLPSEPRSAEASDVVPKLVVATLSSWQEKSRWFAAIHDTIYNDNEEIRQLVKKLVSGKKTDVEKVAALQHWAAQEIRYSGISMGKGEGYTHHPGKMTFADRCGVCKDKAGMLITLMRSAGYEAWPALTMAGARVEEVPADQFNHSVVAWKRPDGTYTMLDPTWVPYSTELWSSAEQEQHYVIGTPWGEDLMQIPYSPPEKHVLKVTSRASIDSVGNLRGSLRLEATNYMDQRLRRWLGTHKRDDLRAYLEGWLSAISPNVKVEKISIGDPLDFDTDFKCDIEYRVKRYAVAGAGTLDFASPAWKLGFSRLTPLLPAYSAVELEKRELPLFIWHTETFSCDEKVTLPAGMKIRGSMKSVSKEGEYASFSMERTQEGNKLINIGKVLIKRRTIPEESYLQFRAILEEAAAYATRRVIFEL